MTTERADYCMLVIKVMSLFVNAESGLGYRFENRNGDMVH